MIQRKIITAFNGDTNAFGYHLENALQAGGISLSQALSDGSESDDESHAKRQVIYVHGAGAYFTHAPEPQETYHAMDVEEYVYRANQGHFCDTPGVHWLRDRNVVNASNGMIVMIRQDHAVAVTNSAPPDTVPAGIYSLIFNNQCGIGLQPYTTTADSYLDLNDFPQQIIQSIDTFLQNVDKWKQLNLLSKRGVLLFGPPGTGKTAVVHHVLQKYAATCRIIIVGNKRPISDLQEFRECLNDGVPTIVVLEELGTRVDGYGEKAALLDFLDGVSSWNNCLTIATTNEPECLSDNIVDRPSRFDKIYYVGPPSEEARRIYLTNKLPNYPEEDMTQLIKFTDGMSIAYLKELVVGLLVYGQSVKGLIDEFLQRKQTIKNHFATGKPVGFF